MSEDVKDDEFDDFEVVLKTDDFIRFLNAYTSESNCPSCGGDRFSTLSKHGYCYVFENKCKGPGGIDLVAPTYAVGCLNCGFLRHHVARLVQEKIAELPDEPIEDSGDEQG